MKNHNNNKTHHELGVQAPEADVLNLGSVPEEGVEGEGEGDEEELEEVIEGAKQNKRMLAERNASLQNKVHQVHHCTAHESPLGQRGGRGGVGGSFVSLHSHTQYVLLSCLNTPHTASLCTSSCHDTKQLLSICCAWWNCCVMQSTGRHMCWGELSSPI